MKPMPTFTSSSVAAAVASLVTIALFVPIVVYARTCDFAYRDERDYVIAALILPLALSFCWLLYSGARALTSWRRSQSIWFALGGTTLAALIAMSVVANTGFYADCYS